MASHKTARTWTDLQESLNRVHQQLGLVPRAGWDGMIINNTHRSAHSAKQRIRQRTYSSPFLPSLADVPQLQREKQLAVHRVCGKVGRKENWRKKTFLFHENAIRDQHGPMHSKVRAACSYLLENKEFAWDFVDTFISEVLSDEFVPDVLIETLTHSFAKSQKRYPPKSHQKRQMKTRLLDLRAPGHSRSSEQFLRSLLEELLLEVLRELSANVLRNAIKDLVDEHLARAATCDIMEDIVSETVQSLLPEAIQDMQQELEWEETLEPLISAVIEVEVRAILVLVLSEYDAELLKLHQNQVAASARKYLVDMFLLEHLTGMHGPALPWKDEESRCLDSWMFNILLKQYFCIQEQRRLTVENLLLGDFHRRAFREVALDVILTELSKTLEEDMEDLLEKESQIEIGEASADCFQLC